MDLNFTSFETAIKTFLDNLAKEDENVCKESMQSQTSQYPKCCKYIIPASRRKIER